MMPFLLITGRLTNAPRRRAYQMLPTFSFEKQQLDLKSSDQSLNLLFESLPQTNSNQFNSPYINTVSVINNNVATNMYVPLVS
jgi:hypothetical protein